MMPSTHHPVSAHLAVDNPPCPSLCLSTSSRIFVSSPSRGRYIQYPRYLYIRSPGGRPAHLYRRSLFYRPLPVLSLLPPRHPPDQARQTDRPTKTTRDCKTIQIQERERKGEAHSRLRASPETFPNIDGGAATSYSPDQRREGLA